MSDDTTTPEEEIPEEDGYGDKDPDDVVDAEDDDSPDPG